jgi:hypothetical protein
MFEYHGWITLHTDIVDEYGDENQEELQRLLSDLRAYIEPLSNRGSMHIEVCNGLYALNMSGHFNHRDEFIVNLFQWLAKRTRSSYGLLYIHDD